MSSSQLVLDTDILSLLMRKNSSVLAKAKEYLAEYERFTISIITHYEILRGLKAKGAEQQASRFEDFCAKNTVLPITDPHLGVLILLRAVAGWANDGRKLKSADGAGLPTASVAKL
jgi:predicted nucleic acid-binding protein